MKSSDRAQPEEVTENQLHIYALGYQELTGQNADYVEIYELDEGKRKPRAVDVDFINDVKYKVTEAADALRQGSLPTLSHATKCSKCDHIALCNAGNIALRYSVTQKSLLDF